MSDSQTSALKPIKPFARQGHGFAVDNYLVDHVMPAIGPAAWKVLSVVMRHTIGWHRDDAQLSNAELQRMTGLANPAVTKALKVLTSEIEGVTVPGTGGILKRHRAGSNAPNTYSVNRDLSVYRLRPRRFGDADE